MKTDGCREWRESLGAYALNQLPDHERTGLEAHLEGCPECRAELESLESVARMMPLADPERFGTPPVPPPELGDRVAASIRDERRSLRRRRRRLGFAFGGATAAAAAVLAIFVLSGGSEPEAEQRVAFGSLPPGMEITATLEPRAFGTEIHMYVKGVRSGTLCRVTLRGPRGVRLPAGTFRYRYGTDEDAVLSSALDLSSTRSIVVNVGTRAFSAPVNAGGAA
jgi:Putative zinc-finger